MGPTYLATAIALARIHGVQFAAAYLCESSIPIEVAVELLVDEFSTVKLNYVEKRVLSTDLPDS